MGLVLEAISYIKLYSNIFTKYDTFNHKKKGMLALLLSSALKKEKKPRKKINSDFFSYNLNGKNLHRIESQNPQMVLF